MIFFFFNTTSLWIITSIFFSPFVAGNKMVAFVVGFLLLSEATVCSSLQLVPSSLLAVPRALTWFVYTLVLVLYEFIPSSFRSQLNILSLVPDIWHVLPQVQSLYMERDHPRRLIDLLVNEGLQHVKDELGFMWIWTGFIHSFSFLRSMQFLKKLNSCLFPLKSSTYYF